MEKNAEMENSLTMTAKKSRKQIALLTAAILLLAGLMIVFTVRLIIYVENSVYQERTVYLKAQAETTAGLINGILERYTDYADLCARTITGEYRSDVEVEEFLQTIGQRLFLSEVRLILIDENTTWYAEGNASGRITVPEYYGEKTPESLVYITTGVDVTTESFVFRQRLEKPVTLRTERGSTKICYCAVIYYMDRLQEEIGAAFPYTCNSFILDKNGLMLYKNFQLTRLVEGTNIFSKYERVGFLHGVSGDQQLEKLKAGETVVGEFRLTRENYFICTAPLSVNQWYVSFVLSSENLAAGSYITTMFIYVLIIGLLLILGLVLTVTVSYKRQQEQKLLETEKLANVQLERASKAKTDFLSNMTHDIRTPINGILGMTAIAAREDNPEKTKECLKKIDLSSRYLLSLVNDVLDMSSIENGKLNIVREPLNLKTFMADCVSIVNGQLQGRSLTILTEYEGLTHPEILGDELHLRQIFINILGNAVKFTPDGGTIRFRACEMAQDKNITNDSVLMVRFEIQDNGIGMSKEFQKIIWDRFSQSKTGARTKYKGTGLGMAITKRLTEAMGGEITVESEERIGSTFYVLLPFELNIRENTEAPQAESDKKPEAAEESKGEEDSAEEEEETLRGLRVLLAEDNEINQEIALDMLEGAGAKVLLAEDGKKAVELFAASEPGSIDLILMDLMMPEQNGLEATRAIREMERDDASSIAIFAMTANVMAEDLEATRRAGMNAHLSKPVNIRALKKEVYRNRKKGAAVPLSGRAQK